MIEHPRRRAICEAVEAEPGIHKSKLGREIGTSPGNLQHHADRLMEDGLLEREILNGYVCFFLPGDVDPEVRPLAGYLRSATARRVLATVRKDPGLSVSNLARALDIAPGTLAYHLDRLEEAGLVVREAYSGRTLLRPGEHGARAAEQLKVG